MAPCKLSSADDVHLTHYILEQERRNSGALAMELRLSCTDPFIPLIY